MGVNENWDYGRPQDRMVVDYSLHGLVTIRLVNAPPSAVRELESLLGPSKGQPADRPDIRISFVDALGPTDGLRYIGLNEAAYDQDRFYLVGDRGQRATFDFAGLGEPCEFICEPGASIFPYLLPVIGLRLLRKGYVMLHSASLVYEDKGILVTGWKKGGKTETLLSFMARGARFMSDEWTILSPAGRMWGLSGTVQIWDWHLRCLPEYWRRLRPAERYRLRLLRLYQRAYRLLPPEMWRRSLVRRWLDQLSVDGGVALIGQARCAPERIFAGQLWDGPATIDIAFLAGVNSAISVSPIEPSEVASRMAASLSYERQSLLSRYDQFRYAFPDRRNRLLESAGERERRYLEQALGDTPTYQILHPYPVPLHALFEASAPSVYRLAPKGDERVSTGPKELVT